MEQEIQRGKQGLGEERNHRGDQKGKGAIQAKIVMRYTNNLINNNSIVFVLNINYIINATALLRKGQESLVLAS